MNGPAGRPGPGPVRKARRARDEWAPGVMRRRYRVTTIDRLNGALVAFAIIAGLVYALAKAAMWLWESV